MADLLLELFSEEIPARMQAKAASDLLDGLTQAMLVEKFIPEESRIHTFVTPRRVAIWATNLPVMQNDVSTDFKGPKLDAPPAALEGFLKKTGLKIEQLEKRDGVYFATIHQKGKPTVEVLKAAIEKILINFPWPKSMRWGSGDATWVRPLHSILCIFDGKVIPVQFGGVTAGNTTKGHRFLSPQPIEITHPADYENALEKAHVIADRDARKAEILAQAEEKAAAQGLTIRKDEALAEEVVGLVEWPVVLVGTIDKQFMELPPEVLTTVMRSHQKYFALVENNGALSSRFLITANMETKDSGKAVVAGNERVLRARFADARFFWDQDKKKTLGEWAKGLETVTYHAKLGTVAEKVQRIVTLAERLADAVPGADKKQVEKAARLCKADLVTGMVGEFAELQGIMGRYYAQAQKEEASVADAIRDHYKPQGPGDSVPSQPVGICIALADKLDTLVSMFAIGEKPTGSKDPFALRRAALGIIRILLENNIRLPLKSLLDFIPMRQIASHKAHEKLVKQTEEKLHEPHKVGKYLTVNETACAEIPEGAKEALIKSLLDFFTDRLKVQLKDQGIRHDVISAVVADGDDDLVRIVERAKALQDFLATEDGKNLLTAYKRAANILGIEEKKDKTSYKAAELQVSLLKEKEETELAALLETKSGQIDTLRKEEKFVEAMRLLATLRAAVDHFFDKVMVNCDDASLRAERLRLLARIRAGMDSIANFAVIEG